MSGMFKKGFKAVREEKQRQDENREKAGKLLWRFFLTKDNEEAQVRFLTEEPINFYEHTVRTTRNGKERFDNVICTINLGECPLCDSGDTPSFKGAFLIYDKRPYEYTDKNGKKQTGQGQVKLYVQGTRVLSQLDRLSERYGLTNRDYVITRSGSGTSTTYMFDRTDETHKLTEAEITNLLPEKLRSMYNGTMDSLYAIVENQLELMANKNYENDIADEDSNDEEINDNSKNLIGVDDEEEKEPVKKPALFKKPKENSVKTLFKK